MARSRRFPAIARRLLAPARRLLAPLAVSFLILPVPVRAAETVVSGNVSGIWTAANGPYHVTDSLLVPAGDTLTIGPCVDVLFDAGVPLVVEGAFHVRGTESDSVRFLPHPSVDPDTGWGGIRIVGGDSSSFAYSRISGVRMRVTPEWHRIVAWGSGLTIDVNASGAPAVRLRRCVVSDNTAYEGGGIRIDRGYVWLDTCTIARNRATYVGGGIGVFVRWITIDRPAREEPIADPRCRIALAATGCTIVDNIAGGGGGFYGALQLTAPVRFTGCRFEGNRGGGAGLAYPPPGSAFDGCVITGNRANSGAGGIGQGNGYLRVTRSLVAANRGSGIVVDAYGRAHVDIDRCTIAGNIAPDIYGGGLGLQLRGAFATLANTIVYANAGGNIAFVPRSDSYSDPILPPATLSVRYSIVGGDTVIAGPGNLNADPQFADTLSYALLPTSPAIDAGDPYFLDMDGSRSDMGWTGGGAHADVPRIAVEPDTLALYDMLAKTLFVRNTGWADLVVDSLSVPMFVDVEAEFPRIVPPDSSIAIPIRRWAFPTRPTRSAEFFRIDTLRVHSNDPWRRVVAVPVTISAATAIGPKAQPPAFSLSPNAPNPFNPSTIIRFSLARSGNARLAVYDVSGRLVRVLADGPRSAGAHEVVWDGRDASGRRVASGVYVYRLVATDGVRVRRMLCIR